MASFFTSISFVICSITVLSLWVIWKVCVWVWLKPRKLEKLLREQGFKGNAPNFLRGDLKEFQRAAKKAQSKSIELSHRIVPRVMPFLVQTVDRYGPMSFFWVGETPRVLIMDPKLIRDILSGKFGHFPKMRLNPLAKMLAEGLSSYEGAKWAKHRNIINPAFHLEKLKMMVPAIYASCTNLVNKWENLLYDGSCELDVWPELQELTRDVISRTAFGSSYEEGHRIFQLQTELIEHTLKTFLSIHIPGITRFLPTKRNKRIKELAREVRIILTNMINKRVNDIKHGRAINSDLLGLLLDSNFKQVQEQSSTKDAGLSINDIIEECKLFYIAGQETTSSLLVWTMIVLSMHQEWQARAREEVLRVFGRKKPTYEGLSCLKIVTMILYEVLRLYPPGATILRYTYEEMKLENITLPEGLQVAIPTLLVHHDHELWGDDAEEFNPERFSEGVSKATKNRVLFLPFGWGPRICIGQDFAVIEAKLVVAMILQHFSFELSPSYVHAPYTLLTLRPQHGAQVILHKL